MGTAAALALGGLVYAATRSSKPGKKLPAPDGEGGTGTTEELPLPAPDKDWNPDDWDGDLPLPTAGEVEGDLTTNWGKTPSELRPLFLLAEQASGIRGAGRMLALIAKRESAFVAT